MNQIGNKVFWGLLLGLVFMMSQAIAEPLKVQAKSTRVLDVATLGKTDKTPLLTNLSYLRDKDSNLSKQEVIYSLNWQQPSVRSVSNFSNYPGWLRFYLTNSSDKTKQLVLVNENPQIQIIELWQRDGDELLPIYQLGELQAFDIRPIDHRFFVMPVTVDPGQTRELYLYGTVGMRDLISRSFLWEGDYFFKSVHLDDLWQVFYFGIVFVMMLYNLIIYFLTKEKSFLYYSLFVLGALLTFLCISGYGFQLLWPKITWLNQRVVYFGFAVMLVFAGMFSIDFLELKKHYPKMEKLIKNLSYLIVAEVILLILLPVENNSLLTFALTVSAVPIYFICWVCGLLVLKKSQDMAIKLYVFSWSLLVLVSLVTIIHESVVSLFSVPTYIAVQVSHCLEVVLLSMALANKITNLKVREKTASAKAEAKAMFFARMSHEIRTPMNGILGLSDILREKAKDDVNRGYAETIFASANALQKIINDILDYSKIDVGKLVVNTQTFEVRKMLNEVHALFEAECTKKDIILTLDVGAGVDEFYEGDESRIRQVLLNFVSNAVKFTMKGGIDILVTYENGCLIFKVMDTGIGISDENQKLLFEPFEQVTTNQLHMENSSGLGLSICRELIKLMGGDIGVHSIVNKGSSFWFKVPLSSAMPELPNDTRNDALHDKEFSGLRVLVAEDNIVNQTVIKSILESLHVDVAVVENGKEAFDYYNLHAQRLSMVFMDCEMPEMDGFEATQKIRRLEGMSSWNHKPIVALTAHVLKHELQGCYDAGMDGVLFKPVAKKDVIETLREHCSSDDVLGENQ